MLKTQITGAKYLSPQTNQMTNLNIAIPADSKDTEFGTSDILLAKDVVTYLNALDSDISKELDTQTDKINKINLSIKQLIDHNLIKIVTELPTTDIDKNCIYLVPNKDGEGNNVFIEYIYVESKNTFEEVGRIQAKVDLSDYYTKEETDNLILIAKNSAINIHNEDNDKYITLDINDPNITDEDTSKVNISMFDIDYPCLTTINARYGFTHRTDDGFISNLDGYGLYVNDGNDSNITKSINISTNKDLTDDEQADEYSPVDISLTDGHNSANINTGRGFMHKTKDGLNSSLDYYGLYVDDGTYLNQINSNLIVMYNGNVNGGIALYSNKSLTEEEQEDGYSKVDLSLNDGDSSVRINAIYGLFLKGNGEYSSNLDTFGVHAYDANCSSHVISDSILLDVNNRVAIDLTTYNDECSIIFGPYNNPKFKISRPINGTEGATITGVKSIAAFSNPSATKVWATDGSTVDLTTKANTSDVLLKKSASGGYYIEENSNELGYKAFTANNSCTASNSYSFAQGCNTKALGYCAHAEGYATTANASSTHAEGESTQATQPGAHAEGYYTLAKSMATHAEGYYTKAVGYYSHSEGNYTEASGFCAHALGTYNIANKNAIHSVGIGNSTTRKNAEYIYSKNNQYASGLEDDPKNGYKYLIGVGGYDGISTDNTTYKSVQEVIADLTSRIEQLETKVRALEAANTPA